MSRLPLLFSLLCLTPAGTALAQATWSLPGPANLIDLRVSKGFYDSDGPSFASFAVIPAVRAAVSPKIDLEIELPLARAAMENRFTGETVSGLVFGNPYIGISAPLSSVVRLRAGFRPGIAKESTESGDWLALEVGMLSEFDRSEAFLPDVHTLRGLLEVGGIPARGAFAQLRAGATMLMSGDDGDDSETLVDYGLRVGMASGSVLVHGGVTGRANISSDNGSFAERSVHQIVAGAAATHGTVRPVVELRFYLDEDLRESVKGIVTIGLLVGI